MDAYTEGQVWVVLPVEVEFVGIVEVLDVAVGPPKCKANRSPALIGQPLTSVSRVTVSDFRAGRPVDASALLPGIANLLDPLLVGTTATYMRSDDAVYPPGLAAKLPRGTRVLVTDGAADWIVPPSTIRSLAQALGTAGTTGPGLRMLNGLDHYLHASGTPENDQPSPRPRSARSRTGRSPTQLRSSRPTNEVVRVSRCHKAATHGQLALANRISNQLMVNGADTATSYGLRVPMVSLGNWTMYEPGSTLGGPDALMSPCVSASLDTGNETVTVWDCPAPSVTRVKPTSRCGGTTTLLTGWAT